jgi:hypothetical protein
MFFASCSSVTRDGIKYTETINIRLTLGISYLTQNFGVLNIGFFERLECGIILVYQGVPSSWTRIEGIDAKINDT